MSKMTGEFRLQTWVATWSQTAEKQGLSLVRRRSASKMCGKNKASATSLPMPDTFHTNPAYEPSDDESPRFHNLEQLNEESESRVVVEPRQGAFAGNAPLPRAGHGSLLRAQAVCLRLHGGYLVWLQSPFLSKYKTTPRKRTRLKYRKSSRLHFH